MIDETRLLAAIRTRAESLIVAATGSATLSATATGYARTTGSFVDERFSIGMEVVPSGFTQTAPGVITAVSALVLTIDGGRTVQSAGAGRSLTVGLPTARFYGNTIGRPTVLVPYVTEETKQNTAAVKTLPTRRGRQEENWLSWWTIYLIAGTGDEAMTRYRTAFKSLFAGGTTLDLGDGTNAFVPGDAAPKSGDLVTADGGWIASQVQLQLRGSTRNVVAA